MDRLELKLSNIPFYRLYAIAFFALNTVLIVFAVIGKHGVDLYPLLALVWASCNVIIVKYTTSVKRYIGLTFLIIAFDGFVDGFAQHQLGVCGDIKWLPPPWALPWDFTAFPYTSLLTTAYIYIMWFGAVVMRSIAMTYYVVDYYVSNKKNPRVFNPVNKLRSILILLIALLYIELFYIADHLNFLIRGYLPVVGIIPAIDWTVSLGWAQLSLLQLFLLLVTGLIIIGLCFSTAFKSWAYVFSIFGLFIFERAILPYIYTITAGPYLALALLIITLMGGVALSIFVHQHNKKVKNWESSTPGEWKVNGLAFAPFLSQI